jgi:hypothetical protein
MQGKVERIERTEAMALTYKGGGGRIKLVGQL